MLRIVNDSGVTRRTQVLNAKTGEDVGKILSIGTGLQVVFDKPEVRAVAELMLMQLDVTTTKTEWKTKHPVTGKPELVAAVEFRDGTRVEFAEDGTPNIRA